ncbi:DUF2971 domain-containing protein [Eoetvoesiella caeni]|uniref:DUF2971 family protein n=1 Tax=Eoetvoesiella caeni TaxID=645616 RepID=A0A366HDW4_9BURK|nr:DUF2971 domain-containing protein [Eoetvoesiella caeni]MCI2809082.1 DUF2971 domain-containing protein [Eoetvoesiella caeni]NYT55417.1 DUF2971 domain-containing protein [Eoetvoesiella caeni]RBP39972.1 DUF2971 family protein [Eoetvoesiella caeni]
MKQSLYKFLPLNTDDHVSRLQRILTGQIYFSSPAYFNDPFEMSALAAPMENPEFEARLAASGCLPGSLSQRGTVRRRYLETFQATALPALIREWIDSLGVLCLTTEKHDLLMWAHYANNHSGICIGFDSDYEPFRDAKPVQYSERRPSLSPDSRYDSGDLLQAALLTKSSHWSHENEWRVIKRPVSDDEKQFYKSLIAEDPGHSDSVAQLLASQGGSGQYEFDPKAIRVVCLGARIRFEDTETVVALLQRHCPHVRIEDMRLDDRHYQLHAKRRAVKRI